jgi:hypothetical protein
MYSTAVLAAENSIPYVEVSIEVCILALAMRGVHPTNLNNPVIDLHVYVSCA